MAPSAPFCPVAFTGAFSTILRPCEDRTSSVPDPDGDDVRPKSCPHKLEDIRLFCPVLHCTFADDKHGSLVVGPTEMKMDLLPTGRDHTVVCLEALYRRPLPADPRTGASVAVAMTRAEGVLLLQEEHLVDDKYTMPSRVVTKSTAEAVYAAAAKRADAVASTALGGDDADVFKFSSVASTLRFVVRLHVRGPPPRPLMREGGEEEERTFADHGVLLPYVNPKFGLEKVEVNVRVPQGVQLLLPKPDVAHYVADRLLSEFRNVWLSPERTGYDDHMATLALTGPFLTSPSVLLWRTSHPADRVRAEPSEEGRPVSRRSSVVLDRGEEVSEVTLTVPESWMGPAAGRLAPAKVLVAVVVDRSGSTVFKEEGSGAKTVLAGLAAYASASVTALKDQVAAVRSTGHAAAADREFHVLTLAFHHECAVLHDGPLEEMDAPSLVGAIAELESGGGTRFASFRAALRRKVEELADGGPVHLASLLLSDGGDMAGDQGLRELVAAVEGSGGTYHQACVGSGRWLSEATMVRNTTDGRSPLLLRKLDREGAARMLSLVPTMIMSCVDPFVARIRGGAVLAVRSPLEASATTEPDDVFAVDPSLSTSVRVRPGEACVLLVLHPQVRPLVVEVEGEEVDVKAAATGDEAGTALAALGMIDPLFSSGVPGRVLDALSARDAVRRIGLAKQLVTSETSSVAVLKREDRLPPPASPAVAPPSTMDAFRNWFRVRVPVGLSEEGWADGTVYRSAIAGEALLRCRSLGADEGSARYRSLDASAPTKTAGSRSVGAAELLQTTKGRIVASHRPSLPSWTGGVDLLRDKVGEVIRSLEEAEKGDAKRRKVVDEATSVHVDKLLLCFEEGGGESPYVSPSDEADCLIAHFVMLGWLSEPSFTMPIENGPRVAILKAGLAHIKKEFPSLC